MTKRRMLVTGAGGMVGSYVRDVFADDELFLTDVAQGGEPLDVRHPARVMAAVGSIKPDIVLHLAAATDVDRCEQEPDWAYHTNAIGTQNVALACQAHGAVLVYISTAGVFWGDKPDPYTEFDAPRPANLYGHSKLAGETIVTSLLSRWYIVRASWMVGGGPLDKKFVGKVVRLILEGTQPLRVVNDKWGSPTFAKDLLKGIHALLETGYYGLYHMANPGSGSRYDVARVVCGALQRPEVAITPIASEEFPLPAPRARSEVLRNLKLELLGLHRMRPWQEALVEYVQTQLLPAGSV
jgi:dTDP-4-dehydrorhamnose reductase